MHPCTHPGTHPCAHPVTTPSTPVLRVRHPFTNVLVHLDCTSGIRETAQTLTRGRPVECGLQVPMRRRCRKCPAQKGLHEVSGVWQRRRVPKRHTNYLNSSYERNVCRNLAQPLTLQIASCPCSVSLEALDKESLQLLCRQLQRVLLRRLCSKGDCARSVRTLQQPLLRKAMLVVVVALCTSLVLQTTGFQGNL